MKVLISGSSHEKGIGYNIAKNLLKEGHTVLITFRKPEEGENALSKLESLGQNKGKVFIHHLEITDKSSIKKICEFIRCKWGKIDCLVNNAGVLFHEKEFKIAQKIIDVNFYGTYNLTIELLPLIEPNGRIVNISSRWGTWIGMKNELKQKFLNFQNHESIHLELNKFLECVKKNKEGDDGFKDYGVKWGGYLVYGVSKLSLNGFTLYLSKVMGVSQCVTCCCPGYCRTKMCGEGASKSPEDGSKTPTWLVTSSKKDTHDGKFFYEKKQLDF